jgi:hypothetical protein
MLRSTVGKTSLSAPPPEAAMTDGFVCMSCQVLMPEVAMKPQTLISRETLPSQLNLVASNRPASADGRPSRRSNRMPGAKWAMAVPSFGAAL